MRRTPIAAVAALAFAAVYQLVPARGPAGPEAGASSAAAPRGFVYYARCDEARAAGAAPIYRGEPGYREPLDRDRDGIACEPYRGR